MSLNELIPLIKDIKNDVKELKAISLTERKNFQLKYVTAERSSWRKEIREIMTDLINIKNKVDVGFGTTLDEDENFYEQDIKRGYFLCIGKLQPNINPYSILESHGSDSYYQTDGRIYDLLKKPNLEDIDKLISYLALLLKFD